jgi:hypothetical protein
MWRLTTCYDQNNHPFLKSTNGHQGRQIWVFDKEAGSDEDQQEIEGLREEFTASRFTQRHSSDELLRKQMRQKLKVRRYSYWLSFPGACGLYSGALQAFPVEWPKD